MKQTNFINQILPLKDKLYRLALSITANPAEAEDIVQETLIKAWDKQNQGQQITSPQAYCLTICRNLAIDRATNKQTTHITLNENQHNHTDNHTPLTNLTLTEAITLLKELTDNLPRIWQDIIYLRDVEGKKYKEIAAELNLSEQQVKVYLFRARQQIKQKYTRINEYGL